MKILHEIPIDEIAEIEIIGNRCKKLDIVGPSCTTVELEVKDLKTGEVLSRYGDLSRSWTMNQYACMAMNTLGCGAGVLAGLPTYGAGYLARKETNESISSVTGVGAKRTVSETAVQNGWRGAVATATFGIVIGTGDTAEALTDYKLITPIADGMEAGQMNYAVMAAPVVTWDVGTGKFKCVGSRVITNNSAGTITVKEVGIYGHGCRNNTGYSDALGTYCYVRDVLGVPVDCDSTSVLTVTYTMYSPAYP